MMDSELGKPSITREDQDELVWDGSDVVCPRLFQESKQEVKPEWGAWLKAPVKRHDQVVDKWLRDEQGMALGNTVSMFQGASLSVSNQGSSTNTTAVNSH